MGQEITKTYTYILVMESDNKYTGWSHSPTKPLKGIGSKWISWNKPLPDDIDTVQYKYENGELKAVTV